MPGLCVCRDTGFFISKIFKEDCMKGKWMPHIVAGMALVVFIGLGLASASAPEPSNISIDGVWDRGDIVITISGDNGVFTQVDPNYRHIEAFNTGMINIGDQQVRNIRRTGYNRFTGELLYVLFDRNSSGAIIRYTGKEWRGCAITVSRDGTIMTIDDIDKYTKMDSGPDSAGTNPNAAAAPQAGTIIQDARLVGTWRASARVGEYPGDVVQFTFNDGQYEVLKEWGADRMNRSLIDPWLKGTYTTDDKGVIATKTTHVYDTSGKKWTSKDEAIANLKSQNRTDAQINDIIARNFIDWSSRYSISSGNVLTIDDVAIDDDDYKERGTFAKQN
jgi:hypothetical protein